MVGKQDTHTFSPSYPDTNAIAYAVLFPLERMPDAPEDTGNCLIARRDLVSLEDDQALEHIGVLTDLSGNLRQREEPEQAVRHSEELQQRDLPPTVGLPPTIYWTTCG